MGPLNLIYKAILSGRKYFHTRLKEPGRLPARVISIGNLSLGGTGKTPSVIAVSREAQKRGCQPCILTRGYKGTAKGPCFVSRGDGPILTANEAGDEPYLMAEKLHGIPIIMGRDRYRSGLFALQTLRAEHAFNASRTIFILDDGFQHISLCRDADVLLVDVTRPLWLERLFPEGRLREPEREMKRADIIVLTKTDMAGDDAISRCIQHIKKHNPSIPVFRSTHKPLSLIKISGECASLETLKKGPVSLFSGIANPEYFRTTLAALGAEIVNFRRFSDHHRYSQRDIDDINREASGCTLVTTEKDLVKLRGLEFTRDISALQIEFSVEDEFYDKLFNI